MEQKKQAGLCLKNLSREINYVSVLRQIDLNVKHGELVCLLGPNGAGKSTLLSTLCAPQILYSGKIFFEGEEITLGTRHQRFLKRCAYLGHEPGLFYDLSVSENIDFFTKILSPCFYSKEAKGKEKWKLLLEMAGLKEYQKKKVRLLSRGMRQKLGLLRCFLRIGAAQKQLYLLDEPLNSLDAEGRQVFRQLLTGAKEEGSIVLVSSHQESFFYEKGHKENTSSLATRFLLLKKGRLLADIPVERYTPKAKVKLKEMLLLD